MARETRRSGETNDGKDIEMDKFIKELSENTPHEDQFKGEEDE